MRYMLSLVAVAAGLGAAVGGDKGKPAVGHIVEASVNDPPQVVDAQVGDIVQLTYGFGVVPGQMPATLKVEVSGKGVTKVAVVSVPNLAPNGKVLVGAGKMAAFLKAEKAGTVTVKVTPEIPDPKTYEVKVKVAGE